MINPARYCSHLAICAAAFAIPCALHAETRDAADGASADMAANSVIANVEAVAFTLAAGGVEAGDVEAGETGAQDSPAQSGGSQTDEGDAPRQRTWPKFELPKIVFDDTWASVGIGVGMVPSYSGSDDYVPFPLPLIVGRVGGIGIRPNGPGFRLDLLSPAPALGPRQDVTFSFGPSFRFRNDRAQQIEDEVVERAEDLDIAIEVGLAGGVTFPGIFTATDSLTFSTQVSADVLGAHDGFLIEPSLGYQRNFGTGTLMQVGLGAQFVDDNFADYYYSLTPAQSAATGLPQFTADGGLNNLSSNLLLNFDLDGNFLNGGFSIYTILGYSRMIGDGADTPFTAERGDPNQFFGGLGVAYTF